NYYAAALAKLLSRISSSENHKEAPQAEAILRPKFLSRKRFSGTIIDQTHIKPVEPRERAPFITAL
ncbi:hypothetical protein CCACVL1_02971, partial [Corchorus capsularis]